MAPACPRMERPSVTLSRTTRTWRQTMRTWRFATPTITGSLLGWRYKARAGDTRAGRGFGVTPPARPIRSSLAVPTGRNRRLRGRLPGITRPSGAMPLPPPQPQLGLTPSILDRLIDPESAGTAIMTGYSAEKMYQAVLRDLEDLLNTRRTAGTLPADL